MAIDKQKDILSVKGYFHTFSDEGIRYSFLIVELPDGVIIYPDKRDKSRITVNVALEISLQELYKISKYRAWWKETSEAVREFGALSPCEVFDRYRNENMWTLVNALKCALHVVFGN